ncbi:unnamed protein product [Gongylonema pulchrum]|uniref:RNase III domain-containing protein n=1 Tax=Gongylonema pulchrum TaxID=637853 RepID=A0A183EDA4_9BILA|nr:unnamed protein product [Gongylonema pulchrum]
MGKFGGSNRKMLADAQQLYYREEHLFDSPAFRLAFERSPPASLVMNEQPAPAENQQMEQTETAPPLICELTVSEVVRETVRHLRSPFLIDSPFVKAATSGPPASIRISSAAMRMHAFRIVRGVILGAFVPAKHGILLNPHFKQHITNKLLEIKSKNTEGYQPAYQCNSRGSRSLYIDALLGLFYATAAVEETTSDIMDFFCMVVRQLTVQMIFEQYRG